MLTRLTSRFMSWLERLFLGKEDVAKLEAAKKRLAESDKQNEAWDRDEAAQLERTHKLVARVRDRAERHRDRKIDTLRPVTIPEIILDEEMR